MKPDNFELESVIDIGDSVICDACGDDYTNSDDSGGFLFGSSAYCPKCAVSRLPNIKSYGEEHFIKARCPKSMSFKDWVLQLRGGDNTIKVYTEKKASPRE